MKDHRLSNRFLGYAFLFFNLLLLLVVIRPGAGGNLNFRVDQFTVKNVVISDGKMKPSESVEYFLTTLDHPMNASETTRYMEGDLHQLFHNKEKGWVYLVKPRGENRKWSPAGHNPQPLLLDLQKKLSPFLGEFPHRFILVFYSPELDTLRIRFHPQKNGNLDFYRKMRDFLNGRL